MPTPKPAARAAAKLSPLQQALAANEALRQAWANVSVADLRAEIAAIAARPEFQAALNDLAPLLAALPDGEDLKKVLNGVVVAGRALPALAAPAPAV